MKVYIDTAPLKSGHAVRGIGAYTRNLVDALKRRKDVRLVSNPSAADVVHYPYFDLFFSTLKVDPKIPTVVTIYDVIPLIYPAHYPSGIKGRLRLQRQKRELKKASTVITISETSKKDIVRFLDVPQEKIYSIHLAPSPKFYQLKDTTLLHRSVEKYNLPEEFVLYVGDVNYNKNIAGLIKAFAKLEYRTQDTGHRLGLVLVGKGFKEDIPEAKNILHLIKELGVTEGLVMPGYVPEEDLVRIYKLATVYCQPSFYEGFGLPVLEAMAAGTPVVAAKTQALVEIAEGAANFADPRDANDIANAIMRIYANEKLRNKLRKKELEHVRRFSWDKTAEATVEVYKRMTNF